MSSSRIQHAREALIRVIEDAREDVARCLAFYEDLEAGMPAEQQWQIQTQTAHVPDYGGIISPESLPPSVVLGQVRESLDQSIEALRDMPEELVAAVFMGIGLGWLQLPYWGPEAADALDRKLNSASDYWRALEASMPSDELWKVKISTSVFRPPISLLTKREESRVGLAGRVLALVRAQTESIDWLLS